MLILITLLILLGTAAGITLWRALQPGFGYAWLLATIGALAAWISVAAWPLRLPIESAPSYWQPESLFPVSPALQADSATWVIALALTCMCLVAILTAPLRALPVNSLTLAGTLTLTAIGLIAVAAQNPLTLLLAWSALDLVELAIVLRTFDNEKQSERAVFSFAMRSAGTGLLMWAAVYSTNAGVSLTFTTISPHASMYLLLASAFRMGMLPFHLPYAGAPILRRGFGTIIRLVSATASLALLAHLPQGAIDSAFAPWLLLIIGMTALFASWRWFRATDELGGRPYWIIGVGALAVISALGNNQNGSTAYGLMLILIGSLVFFYSHAASSARWLTLPALPLALGLPFTFTTTVWDLKTSLDWWFWPFVLGAHVLLLGGFARFMLMPKPTLPINQTWQGIFYPIALGLLTVTTLLLGLWGWTGALTLGTWWLGLIATALAVLLIWLRVRLKRLMADQNNLQSDSRQPISRPDQLSAGLWSIYYGLRRISDLFTHTLEGDGGILWTLVLLALLITLVQGGR